MERDVKELEICLLIENMRQIQTMYYARYVRKLTCHFKHPGLNDGECIRAPDSVVNTYNTLPSLWRRAL